ncbi:P-loop containing nucleoside triphosphate hydrolase protein [Morchella conica CCBAS932]|uniref:RNA helicase n=1 Tax=Morchella conica CCBAS932 TaxID=1392247 RepID=A0A3N4KX41_9PEZI|nr:P-loop containing nucleoside triphosphate hydrolase protein [Morchella conica CCBAS932]
MARGKKKRAAPPATNPLPLKRLKKSTTNSHAVSIDKLGWQKVSMPDRLDDVEGFMGMEEVEGVEIVRKSDGSFEYKKIAGMPANSKSSRANETEGGTEEEAWKGIVEVGGHVKEKVKLKKPKGKKKIIKEIAKTEGSAGNAFAVLSDDDEDVSLPAWGPLNLSLPVLRALSQMSFTSPTPIQSAAIPEIVNGRDFIGKASTGSGKTLAFGIPIMEYYLKRYCHEIDGEIEKPERLPVALVLSPTRELAYQLHSHLISLAAFIPEIRIVSVTGGLSIQKQLRQLTENGGADVIVATPGRLWEVISEGQGWIERLRKGLKFLVVDEADRLLQEGHYKEVIEVLHLLAKRTENPDEGESEEDRAGSEIESSDEKSVKFNNKSKTREIEKVERQTLVFSATFHRGLQQKLAGKSSKKSIGGDLMDEKESMEYLLKKLYFREKSPKFVDVNPTGQLAERLSEGIIECGAMEKDLYLYFLLLRYPSRTLVFTNSISSVKRLAPFLAMLQLPAYPLHSGMIQKARLRSLERFSSSSNPNSILIATDVAARGLDIKNVDMIIHYHLPRTADMYVHRSGRTARGINARGVSVLLCSPDEVLSVRRLVGKVHESDPTVKSTGRYLMKGFNVDRKLVNRLKPRIDLAKKIADSSIEKQKKGHEDEWLKTAAQELGVDYNSDEFSKNGNARRGRQGSKIKKDRAASATKGDLASWKAQLNELLKHKVNSGFSELYLTSGTVNLAHSLFQAQLEGKSRDGFLGLEERSALEEVGG